MISIGRLGVGAEGYYLDAVARGAEEYYSVRGEMRGRWVGAGAGALGLAGEVSGADLGVLLAGRDPVTGRSLASSARKVPGFDVTFSAPKSVSLLFALSNPEVSAQVVAAHEAAVDATLDYLEGSACRTRRGHAGAIRLRAEGFVGAAFRHRTSRAGDPQLHTHVLVANLVRGSDGVWATLDSRGLYRHARTGGYLYQAHLRAGLTERLGVAWGPVLKGCAELEGIAAPVLRAFSRRRIEIEIALTATGSTGPEAARGAALSTRRPKGYDRDAGSLREEWHQRAQTVGLDPGRVARLLGRAPRRDVPEPEPDHGVLAARLTEDTATFDDRAVLRAIAEAARRGETIEHIGVQARRFLADPEVVHVAPGCYSTLEMLALERAVVTSAEARLHSRVGVVATPVLAGALEGAPELSGEQHAMVSQLTSAGHGVEVVVGVAGAGKTQALAVAAAAWDAAGYQVRGAALAARAATELEARAHIPSCTLDRLLGDLDRSECPLPPHTVLVVDEAAMVGTRKLARILTHAENARAKVVLVGDDHQLPEIQAGGAFSGLARRLPPIRLHQSQRHHDPIERRALAALRAGHTDRAVHQLSAHGRVTLAATRDRAHHLMVTDWLTARHHGPAVMLAVRRADVAALNRQARAALVAAGEVAPHGIEVNAQMFAVGDRVLTLRNWYPRGITNGTRGTITGINRAGIAVHLDTGPQITLPPDYLRAGHLTHGYAMTIHKAQGMTTDRSLVLGDDALFREAAYTALSRGRLENKLYILAPEDPHDEIGHSASGPGPDAERELVATLDTSRAKTMAIDTPGPPPPLLRAPDLGLEL